MAILSKTVESIQRGQARTVVQELAIATVDTGLTDPIDVGGFDTATVQFTVTGSGSFGTTVLTVRRSNDKQSWVGLPIAATISANGGMTDIFEVFGFKYLNVFVTTASGGTQADTGQVTVHLDPGV